MNLSVYVAVVARISGAERINGIDQETGKNLVKEAGKNILGGFHDGWGHH